MLYLYNICFTAALYARLAAKHGNVLLEAGVECKDLEEVSKKWLQEKLPKSMYFI